MAVNKWQEVLVRSNTWEGRSPEFYQDGVYLPQFFDPNGGDLTDHDLKEALGNPEKSALAESLLKESRYAVKGESTEERFTQWMKLAAGHVADCRTMITPTSFALDRPAMNRLLPYQPTVQGYYAHKLPGRPLEFRAA